MHSRRRCHYLVALIVVCLGLASSYASASSPPEPVTPVDLPNDRSVWCGSGGSFFVQACPSFQERQRLWTYEETVAAAKEALSLLLRGQQRMDDILMHKDIRVFHLFGDKFIRDEWILLSAQDIGYQFSKQNYDWDNQHIQGFKSCASASDALGALYNFFRDNVLNGHSVSYLEKDDESQLLRKSLSANVAACREQLALL